MNSNIKSFFFAVLLLFFSVSSMATIYQTISNGNWSKSSIWSPSKPNPTWGFTDTVVINHQVDMNLNLNMFGVLIINSGKSLGDTKKNFTLADGAELINYGTLTSNNFTADWGINTITNYGTIDAGNNMNLYEGYFYNSGIININKDFINQYDASFVNYSSGSITVGDDFKNREDFINQGTLNVNDDFTNDWSCNFTNSGILISGGDLKNSGTFASSGSLTIGDDFTNDWSSSFSNTGTVSVSEDIENKGTMSNTGTGGITAGEDFVNKGSLTNSTSLSITGSFTNDWSTTLSNSGNLNIGDDFTNKGTTTNLGTLVVANDATNKGTLDNYNTLYLGKNLHNDFGCDITNIGVMTVVNNVVNNGTVENDGTLEVDGNYSGSGDVTGDGSLCNSDGVTDPTGGAKGVTCEICGTDGATLPVELIEFTAHSSGLNISLHWNTASEVNNNYFEVLRSTDGVNFELVNIVHGNGNSNTTVEYNADDHLNASGIYYYQLKQVDFDGNYTLSNIISVMIEQKVEIMVYPNPVNISEAITIETNSQTLKTIYIQDINGKIVYQEVISEPTLKLQSDNLKPGVYFLRILSNENQQFTKKLIIQ